MHDLATREKSKQVCQLVHVRGRPRLHLLRKHRRGRDDGATYAAAVTYQLRRRLMRVSVGRSRAREKTKMMIRLRTYAPPAAVRWTVRTFRLPIRCCTRRLYFFFLDTRLLY
jgi:hypothetical protein